MTHRDTLFICFSDIHANEQRIPRIKAKLDRLSIRAKTLKDKYNKSYIVFLVPGDIAFSGKESEYKLIEECFKNLAKIGEIIISPGNHDFDFDGTDDEMRKTLLELCSKSDVNEKRVRNITEGQASFESFRSNIPSSLEKIEKLLSNKYILSKELSVISLNSSWCSFISEKSGDLFFPEKELIQDESHKINIAMMHHPLTWYEASNSKEIRNILLNNYNIILTGHEHESTGLSISKEGNSVIFIENLPLDDSSSNEQGFSYFLFEDEKVVIKKSIWTNEDYAAGTVVKEENAVSVIKEENPSKQIYISSLKDVGANIIHPEKEKLDLEDIFIYPNLSRVSNKATTLNRVSSENIVEKLILAPCNFLIIGEESSGKTTLLKKMFLDLDRKGVSTIIISSSDVRKIRNFDSENLKRFILKQQGCKSLEDFIESSDRKVLLFDDIDNSNVNSRNFEKFYQSMTSIFDSLVITVSDSFKFDQSSINPIERLSEFERYEILRFGYRLRYELIEKWNALYEHNQDSKEKLIHANHNANEIFDKVLAKGVIPSLPLFLIMMLQSGDNQNISEANTSTYGYYYQYLITTAMGQANIKKDDLDAYFQYLCDFSYELFNNSVKSLSLDEFEDFNRKIKDKYGIEFNNQERLSKLEKSNIFSNNNELISFKYHYIFFFFLAKFLSENINRCEVDINEIIKNIHLKRNMNILMFLTHHSKDPRILNGIINKSRKTLSEFSPSDVDKGTQFVNDIMSSDPIIEYKEELKDPDNYRKVSAEKKDQIYNENDESQEEEEDYPDFINNVLTSFKSAEILSQLAKNYYGSLEKDKKSSLIDEAIEAPLRALEAIVSFFRDEPDRLIEHVKINLKKSNGANITSEDEADKLAREAIFNLVLTLCYTTIAKISFSIADKNIRKIVNDVCEGNDSHSYALISFVSKMETGKNINIDELRRLCSKLHKNVLAMTVLRGFVLRYLYMFEVRDKQIRY